MQGTFSPAAGALLYLQLTSFRNRVVSRIRRLREPKYLIGGLIGAAYIYFVFLRRAGAGRVPVAGLPPEALQLVGALGALALLVIVALAWIFVRARPSIAFNEAEVAFLFTAPVRRRTLIHYRLLTSQVALFFTGVVLAIVSQRWRALGATGAMYAIGWWLILATINLHFTGASFVITRLRDRGITTLRRRAVALVVVSLVAAIAILWARHEVPPPGAAELGDLPAIRSYVVALLESRPFAILLFIPRLLIAPLQAADATGFLLAFGPALVVLVAHYFWVVQAEVAFEEAAAIRAEKQAERIAAIQRGDWRSVTRRSKPGASPFKLRATGPPEIAFLWKNLHAGPSFARLPVWLAFAGAIVVVCAVIAARPQLRGFLEVLGAIALMATAAMLVVGAHVVTQDLRLDLQSSDILKTCPVSGRTIVLGEVLAPTVILTSVLWLLLIVVAFAVLLADAGRAWSLLSPELLAGMVLAAACVAPPLFALQLLVPNAMAVLFPAWIHRAGARGEHGLDVMGQRILMLFGQVLIILLALLPVALATAILYYLVLLLAGPVVALAIAAAGVIVMLSVQVWAGASWLGSRFERMDLSSELRP